jgi:hypothetical protein
MTTQQHKCGWAGCKNPATHVLHHKWGKVAGRLTCCSAHVPTWAKQVADGTETEWYRVEIIKQ